MTKEIISSDVLIEQFKLGYNKGYLDALKEVENNMILICKNNFKSFTWKWMTLEENIKQLKEKVKE